jgi:hypothetical protein
MEELAMYDKWWTKPSLIARGKAEAKRERRRERNLMLVLKGALNVYNGPVQARQNRP